MSTNAMVREEKSNNCSVLARSNDWQDVTSKLVPPASVTSESILPTSVPSELVPPASVTSEFMLPTSVTCEFVPPSVTSEVVL